MKTWSYGINSLYKKASIDLQEASWWIFSLERVTEMLCDLIPPISLPMIKKRLKNSEDISMNGGNQWTTWKEWYGDLSQLFHCVVHMPIFNFCQKKTRLKSIAFDYDKVKEMFYEEDKEFWDKEMEIF